ncbi:transmembrane emp24 domain-containing protein p24beta3 isoform X1 [Physcomitrium patens]|uniref:GOLD domain-containing protein n=1 Tax=Physcomitrium patens TaxID=3218 RepID=A9RFU0_PHYPA|nr:transmembrane emp24 domain-containing protein p24beta3-like isoform X1 [Physcomitrium patens]PNR59330.1 hypothetical protein PHYPA_002121 [Physcomitrium patens]|eukprot:XP_024366529.1 transmembrane emp24 domain-containing protein p24beta3-like isoform X1 [Physcomitrella patens]
MELRPWITVLFALAVVVAHSHALLMTVHNTECVWEDVEFDGDVVSGNFVVLDQEVFWGSEHPGIELIVTGPDGRAVHTTNTIDGEKFEFIAHRRGRYKFCFHNPLSAPEQLTFYIHVGHVIGVEELARDEHLKPVDVKISQLSEALELVSAEIRYLQNRDLRHRKTNESTQRRLLFYTVSEYLLLIAASVGQVVMIRHLFSKRIGYNRV